jgi:transcriptional regulator with PAS, ATPase and Fis domain
VEVKIPRLIDRLEDLTLLGQYFMDRFSKRFNKHVNRIERRANLRLARHNWPGNVRELENVIGHGVMMAADDVIELQDLPGYLLRPEHPADTVVEPTGQPQSA